MMQMLSISQPWRWGYLFGSYALGVALAGGSWEEASIFLWGMFFTLPANLLLYGAEHTFDQQSLTQHPADTILGELRSYSLWWWIIGINVPCILFGYATLGNHARDLLQVFLFLSLFTSAPPLRLKTYPIIDTLLSLLYLLPGMMGYTIAGGTGYSTVLLGAAALLCMALHLQQSVRQHEQNKAIKDRSLVDLIGLQPTVIVSGVMVAVALYWLEPLLQGWVVVIAALQLWWLIALVRGKRTPQHLEWLQHGVYYASMLLSWWYIS